MNKAKQFILENSEEFSKAVDNGYDIQMTEDEILYWMEKYSVNEIKNYIHKTTVPVYHKHCEGGKSW